MDDRRSYDAVLCDLDGVLRLYADGNPPLERDLGLEPGTLFSVAFTPGMVDRAVTGEITHEEWQDEIAERLTELCGSAEDAAELARCFTTWPQRVNTPMLELLSAVRRRVPVVLVTNATTRLEKDLDRLGLLNAVDEIVNSSAVGVAKPDRRIYEIAAERAGVPPRRCVFIDDREENVAAARDLGMTAVLYRDPETVRAVLGL
ncbi:HAD-IA family hydrolase [Thermostaphylospora chromogena]|uniref:Putative hydrolase of the HAD superfamily n=1 Tax=Thermostaphylospora chromogena TaxID=35622 RepID=A0A1H1CBJ5_9ACTN|nr:HAD-IA family hydrolase [Thermostaphylospora chromogena]SDQ61585.1 putative hydrolase of the HAD superfamily [Thermostaphylospora chromogena]